MAEAPAWLRPLLKKKHVVSDVIGLPLGEMFACGMFGCAFDSTDPWAVKITMDETEAPMWAAIQDFQEQSPNESAGVARVKDIVRLRPDAKHRRKTVPVYAVVREEISPLWAGPKEGYFSDLTLRHLDVPEPLWEKVRHYQSLWSPSVEEEVPAETWERMLDFRRLLEGVLVFREAAVHYHASQGDPDSLAALAAVKMGRKEHGQAAQRGFDKAFELMDNRMAVFIRNALAGLAKRYGIYLRDVHWENIGWRVHEVIDGEELPVVPIIFDPGFTPSTGTMEIREALVANGEVGPMPDELRQAIYWELLAAEDIVEACSAPATALAGLLGNHAPDDDEVERIVQAVWS